MPVYGSKSTISSFKNWKRSIVVAQVVSASLFLSGCDDEVVASPKPERSVDVSVVQLETTDIPQDFRFVGRTASSQRVEIRARVSGFINEISYHEGGAVQEGDQLFQIDPLPFEASLRAAKAELAQQQARLEIAESLLARIEPLIENKAIALKEIDDARGRVKEAQAAIEGAKARVYDAELDLGYATIVSPLSGLTSYATQREGAYINNTAGALTYVAKIDPIWVEFSVSESQMLKGRQATVDGTIESPIDSSYQVELTLGDGTVHPHRGKITFADASLSEKTGTFLIRADIPNPEETLRPGQYVQINLKGAYRPDAIAVPLKAMFQGSKGAYVWVVDDQGKAEQRPVFPGPWLDDKWIINKGLGQNDRVIVDGQQRLAPGVSVNIVDIQRTPTLDLGTGGAP
jgi:membrane fusion protein, multidrug efflux system